MKLVEKENGQIFEICTSEKEAKENLKDILCDNKEIWQDEDSSLYIEYKDNTSITIVFGESTKHIKKSNIKKMNYSNSATNIIYNCNIVYNEKYEDYEIA